MEAGKENEEVGNDFEAAGNKSKLSVYCWVNWLIHFY